MATDAKARRSTPLPASRHAGVDLRAAGVVGGPWPERATFGQEFVRGSALMSDALEGEATARLALLRARRFESGLDWFLRC